MVSRDFKSFLDSQRQKIKVKAKCLGIGMAHYFNNNRIKKNQIYFFKQKHFENALKRLDQQVEN